MQWALLILISLSLIWPLSAGAEKPQAAKPQTEKPHAGKAYRLNAADQKQFDSMSAEQRAALLKQSTKQWQDMRIEEKKTMEEFYAAQEEEINNFNKSKVGKKKSK